MHTKQIALDGTRNFRSLINMPAADGRRIAGHTLLRSDQLNKLSGSDWATLEAIGLRAVCDLRSPQERERYPNRIAIQSVRELPMALISDIRADPTLMALMHENPTVEGAAEMMREVYRRLPDALAPHLPLMFGLLRSGEVPMLIHCAAGKDRTGFAVAVILHVLGVSMPDILADYERSAPSQMTLDPRYQQYFDEMAREAFGDICTPEMVAVVLDARPEFLQTAYEAVQASYGSMEDYLCASAGLDVAAIASLRDRWLD